MQVQLLRFGSIEVEGRKFQNDIVIGEAEYGNGRRSLRSHTAMSTGIPLCRLMRSSPGRRPADHRHRSLWLATDHAPGSRGG